jgi:hypothetical protein
VRYHTVTVTVITCVRKPRLDDCDMSMMTGGHQNVVSSYLYLINISPEELLTYTWLSANVS